ncbi:AAA family ATPase [Streptomyces graminilatus]|uniref:AAA family ATPase n=1 Tax=Streptomyces graminilatus TaxID=1464070 RepID=UPI00099E219D|nr:AAA family ATPase [Streptomyces graminilatus]
MRLENIKIENFRGLTHVDVPFSRFGCLIGENNAGKSSVFQALNMFLRSGIAADTDFLDRKRAIRIQLTFGGIVDADLMRLEAGHRSRIERDIRDGKITLSRVYEGSGKGTFRVVTRVPKDHRYTKLVIDDTLKPGLSPEVIAANVAEVYPEVAEKLQGKISRAAVRREISVITEAFSDADYTAGDETLPTGLDKSISPLLPEPIYIPAVKELNEEVKTTSTATFGRLLALLFGQIEHQLPELESSFEALRGQLNVVTDENGKESDKRLAEVRKIESLIQNNLQESFPRANVRLEIPPPRLRSLLEEAQISIDDGISGHFKTKGDGLRRSVAFAILRAYVDMKTSHPVTTDRTQQPCLLLFEEPEVFLHPRAQRKLFEALTFFSEFNDVLVSTHSSSFYAPGATGTFVKVIKDHALDPPASRTCVIDLSNMEARDQFEIIKHENNEAAFFANSVLLVEGPSDHVLVPHIARTLNAEWDFEKHAAAIAKVEGKGSIARYRNFFSRFEMRVAVLADLDALISGFDKLGASKDCHRMRDLLITKVKEMAEAEDLGSEVSGKTLKSMRSSGAVQEIWKQARNKRELYAQGLCEWEELDKAVSEFFARSISGTMRRILEEATEPELRKLKLELLQALREEDIYVWERGAIEDYYPALGQNESANKNDRARTFCERHVTAEDIRGLPVFKDSDQCEFDLIFESFFGASSSELAGQIPNQLGSDSVTPSPVGDGG